MPTETTPNTPSTQTQTQTQTQPRLPREIFIDIVDRAASTLNPYTLSSLALVSQYCRIQANERRFSAIYSDVPERFARLAVLFLRQSVVPGMLNVASFVTHFQYGAGYAYTATPSGGNGSASAVAISSSRDHKSMNPFVSQTMSTILRHLFRASPYYTPPSTSFVLNLDPSEPDPLDAGGEGISWDAFHPSFTGAFVDLCQHSRMTELWLANVHSVPAGILRCSGTLRHLRLDHVCAGAGPSRHVFPHGVAAGGWGAGGGSGGGGGEQTVLETLHVYGFVSLKSIVRILCGMEVPSPDLFSHLKELRVVLCLFEDINLANQILSTATSVQSMTLSLRSVDSFANSPGTGPVPFIQYRHLPSLKKLTLLNLFDFKVESGISPWSFIGVSVPPNLHEIAMIISDHIDIDSDAISDTDLFQDTYFAEVDDFFAKSAFGGVRRVVVIAQVILDRRSERYDAQAFEMRCAEYVRGLLPQLARMVVPCLVVRVDVVPLYWS